MFAAGLLRGSLWTSPSRTPPYVSVASLWCGVTCHFEVGAVCSLHSEGDCSDRGPHRGLLMATGCSTCPLEASPRGWAVLGRGHPSGLADSGPRDGAWLPQGDSYTGSE